jgi:hypothetical protein
MNAAKLEARRAIFTRREVPRGQWLCCNENTWGSHDIKNFGKALRDFAAKYLTPQCNFTSDRMICVSADVRRVVAALGAEVEAVKCDTEEKTAAAKKKIAQRYAEVHVPQIINHHCGDCTGCDATWCAMRRIQIESPDMDEITRECKYFGIDGDSGGPRFQCWLDMSPGTMESLRGVLKKRYTWKWLLALCGMKDNSSADAACAARDEQNRKDKLRKRMKHTKLTRTTRKSRMGERQGKEVKGWKQPRKSDRYRTDSTHAAPAKKRVKKKKGLSKPKDPVCKHCGCDHLTRNCSQP